MGYNGPQGVFIKYDMNLGGVHHFPQGRVKGRTPTAQGGPGGGVITRLSPLWTHMSTIPFQSVKIKSVKMKSFAQNCQSFPELMKLTFLKV